LFVCFFNSAKEPGRTGTQGHSGIPKTKPRPKRCAQSRKAGERKEECEDKGGKEKSREVRREAAGIREAEMMRENEHEGASGD
jgi:hypothetical protein